MKMMLIRDRSKVVVRQHRRKDTEFVAKFRRYDREPALKRRLDCENHVSAPYARRGNIEKSFADVAQW